MDSQNRNQNKNSNQNSNKSSQNSNQNNSQNITGYLYAGDHAVPLLSVYSESRDKPVGDNPFHADDRYYANDMHGASEFFADNHFWNTIEFEGGGTFNIGLRCQQREEANWCIFDNFKLEYYSDFHFQVQLVLWSLLLFLHLTLLDRL